jgi:hypothetical protein
MMWAEGVQSIWTMPNIHAAGPDGKIRDGCRAFETLRVIYDLGNNFETVRAARERMRKGIVASDSIRKSQEKSSTSLTAVTTRFELRVVDNPIRSAEARYIREQGMVRFNLLLENLSDKLFPPQ